MPFLLLPPLLLLLDLLWGAEAARDQLSSPEEFSIQVQESVTVQEGLCAYVPCTFSYPAQSFQEAEVVYGYWFRKGSHGRKDEPVASNNADQNLWLGTQDSFHLVGAPHNFQCSLDIRDAKASHSGTYYFQFQRGRLKHSYLNNTLTLIVTALSERPEILISGILMLGYPRNLVCSVPWACDHSMLPVISWMSAALTSLGPRTSLSSVIAITPQIQDNGTNITCQVYFPGAGVTVERTIQLHVFKEQETSLEEGLRSVKNRSEKIREMAGVVEGVIEGIGITILLGICLFLVFFLMRRHRMKKVKKEGSKDSESDYFGSEVDLSSKKLSRDSVSNMSQYLKKDTSDESEKGDSESLT